MKVFDIHYPVVMQVEIGFLVVEFQGEAAAVQVDRDVPALPDELVHTAACRLETEITGGVELEQLSR